LHQAYGPDTSNQNNFLNRAVPNSNGYQRNAGLPVGVKKAYPIDLRDIVFGAAFSQFLSKRFLYLNDLLFSVIYRPDTDLIYRQKKGMLFWDIWSDLLIKAADKYNINIASLSNIKEEQNLLLDHFLSKPPGLGTSPGTAVQLAQTEGGPSSQGYVGKPIPALPAGASWGNPLFSYLKLPYSQGSLVIPTAGLGGYLQNAGLPVGAKPGHFYFGKNSWRNLHCPLPTAKNSQAYTLALPSPPLSAQAGLQSRGLGQAQGALIKNGLIISFVLL
jgi:hypothetical protein